MTHIIDNWKNCYPSNWKNLIVKDAITHPAKYSSKLIRKIYEHIVEEGWVKAGDHVADPFGGVALGALDAMRLGLAWRGIELEPKFAALGNENIALWNSKFSQMPKWCSDAVLLQGDSRKLVELLRDQKQVISSPPYANRDVPQDDRDFSKMGEYLAKKHKRTMKRSADLMSSGGYGETEGQLGIMPIGNFNQIISSPPFRQASGGAHIPKGMEVTDPGLLARHTAGNSAAEGYGATEGQLANMGEGDFQQVISSPPYFPQSDRRVPFGTTKGTTLQEEDVRRGYKADNSFRGYYSHNPDNLGNPTGADQSTFWDAALLIVQQTYAILEPGGHACWVVKDFVRNKKIEPFCDQWRQLCESVGFVTLHEHHAELVRHHGTSHTLEGGEVKHVKSSKSFFRRVAESHGSPEINWETVYCMVKE